MISVIAHIKNEIDFKNILFNSLRKQKAEYELLELYVNRNIHKSPAGLFNECYHKAKGDYIMFTNEYFSFDDEKWLEKVENILKGLKDLGAAGIAGLSSTGTTWKNRLRITKGVYDERPFNEILPINNSQIVQTLDDNLLLIPREVFKKIKFDNINFDGDFFFGADYCLRLSRINLKSYCIPAPCRIHKSPLDEKIWKARQIYDYKRKLFLNNYRLNKNIYTYLGISSKCHLFMDSIYLFINKYILSFRRRFFLTIWKKAATGCDSILNLGCGNHFPDVGKNISFSVGVELYEPALQKSKLLNIHHHYIRGDIRKIKFKPHSFDAVAAIEVLEHLTKSEGSELLKNMDLWARKKVIVTTPNGYINQDELDLNPYQVHKSGWEADDFKKLGFITRGIGGLKILKGEVARIKFQPFQLWMAISILSNVLTYFFPRLDHRLLAIKKL